MCNEAYRLLAFYNFNESSASTHICKLPVVLAMIIRNEMFQKMEGLRKKNRKAYTVLEMISELENIECTRNNVGKYRRRYALTSKQKQILKQFDIDEKYIDRSVSEYSY